MIWSDPLIPGTPAFTIAASKAMRIRVLAGPGTGKSFAVKQRVARLLEEGVPPEQILAVTFTRVAAGDLHRELTAADVSGSESLAATTLHSLAFKLLSKNSVLEALGRSSRIVNDYERRPMEHDLADGGLGLRDVRDFVKKFEADWATLQSDEPGFTHDQEEIEFAQKLEAWMKFHESMLIGEVIPKLREFLANDPTAEERSLYRYVLVDEYQDLNKCEQSLVELLSGDADICVVGDDDQSIYSFRHAHPAGIREWAADDAKLEDVTLADCRRCPTAVTNGLNSLIAHNVDRPTPKALQPMPANGPGHVRVHVHATLQEEAESIGDQVRHLLEDEGVPAGDVLILAQRRVIGNTIYGQLQSKGIPGRTYYIESELEEEEAQEKLSLLKLYVNKSDRTALRWYIGRGSNRWGSAGYARIRAACETEGLTPREVLEQLDSGSRTISYTEKLVGRFRELLTIEAALDSMGSVGEVVDHLVPETSAETASLRTLCKEVLSVTPAADPEHFLTALTQAIAKPEAPHEVKDVRIMSFHRSKGLSAPVTFVAGCVQGVMPSAPRETKKHKPTPLEVAEYEREQRRLFYVGISRVKADPSEGKPGRLIVSYPKSMTKKACYASGIPPARVVGADAILHPSKFLKELGPTFPKPTQV